MKAISGPGDLDVFNWDNLDKIHCLLNWTLDKLCSSEFVSNTKLECNRSSDLVNIEQVANANLLCAGSSGHLSFLSSTAGKWIVVYLLWATAWTLWRTNVKEWENGSLDRDTGLSVSLLAKSSSSFNELWQNAKQKKMKYARDKHNSQYIIVKSLRSRSRPKLIMWALCTFALLIFRLHKLGIEAHAYAHYTSLLCFGLSPKLRLAERKLMSWNTSACY